MFLFCLMQISFTPNYLNKIITQHFGMSTKQF